MFDSVKNHRTIPAVGHTHSDSIKGLKEYQARMETQPSDALYLAWFDEIDTTLDENPKSASDLKAILKQSSHKNSGLIITGQNANVRNLKGGFDRSDMNNFVCCHIGDNYRDAIANSHLSEAEKSGLMKTGDALTDWCVLKNCEDNLDNSDTAAYRYALVIEPNKKPFFMILPEFGEYVWQAQTEAINSTSETNTIDSDTVTVSINPRNCPRCDTASKRNGYVKNVTPRVQRYKCKNDECNHEFS
jgi:adenylate kinase family enzyme